jgi:hypothetical protein
MRTISQTYTRTALTAFGLSCMMFASSAFANVVNHNITEAEVTKAQQAWGKALIQISDDFGKGGLPLATQTAKAVLDQAYGYNLGPVLFKPTLTSGEQTFRTSYEGALSYFVGANPKFSQDGGFALKGWTGYQFNNAAVMINGDLALTMGHVMLTDKHGKVTTVDKTWGFKKSPDGSIRIVLHHSSLPYSAK